MRAAVALGEDAVALAAYEQLRSALSEALGADPSAATRDLHLSILQSHPLVAPRGDPGAGAGPDHAGGPRPRAVHPRCCMGGSGRRHRRSACSCAASPASARPRWPARSAGWRRARSCCRRAASRPSARCSCSRWSRRSAACVAGLSTSVINDVVVERADVLASLVPAVAAVRGAAHASGVTSPDAGRRQAYDAITGFLRRLSRHQPLVLLLDDLHNVGLATVDLLHYLVRTLSGSALLIVATVRPDEGAEAIARLSAVSHGARSRAARRRGRDRARHRRRPAAAPRRDPQLDRRGTRCSSPRRSTRWPPARPASPCRSRTRCSPGLPGRVARPRRSCGSPQSSVRPSRRPTWWR